MLLRTISDLDPNYGDVSLVGVDRAYILASEWRRKASF